jgi:pimeloyl-ACP methyl ester carboxylesterase
MTALLPGCELAEVSGAGHMVFEDNPDAFLRATRMWLSRQIGASKGS